MRKLLFLLTTAMVALAVIGCGGNGDPLSRAKPDIRVVHALNGEGSVDVFVDNTLAMDDGAFGTWSTYAPYGSGDRTVSFRDALSQGAIAQVTADFQAETDYTVIGAGPAGTRQVLIFEDTNEASTDKARIRVINASNNLGMVDVYVTAPGVPLTGVVPTADNLEYRSASATYFEFDPGTVEIRVTDDNDQNQVATVTAVLEAEDVRTAVIVDGPFGPQILFLGDLN